MSTKETIQAVRASLSAARMKTFEVATGATGDEDAKALALYAWNVKVSAALLPPLHVCEIVLRNAVAEAIEHVYGPRWPWSIGFEQSLPSSKGGYNPQRDLQNARSRMATTGKVIPELKFVFWQKMLTSRHDGRLWNPYLFKVLPNLSTAIAVGELRAKIYDDLEQVRDLRNRIAHHEPIFTRNLTLELERIIALVELRCRITAAWMIENQDASTVISERP
jgi:hypothetical protein